MFAESRKTSESFGCMRDIFVLLTFYTSSCIVQTVSQLYNHRRLSDPPHTTETNIFGAVDDLPSTTTDPLTKDFASLHEKMPTV